jgi:Zn-dependent membrane protease YugP
MLFNFIEKKKIFELRKKYLPIAHVLNRAGIAIMWSFPVLGLVLRSPSAMGIAVGCSLLLQLIGALAYLIILPEEWDASFNKALPILMEGEYVALDQLPNIRNVLKAAAITYFASALANVLNIGRWLLLLRR